MSEWADNKVAGCPDTRDCGAMNKSDAIWNMTITDLLERRVRECPEQVLAKANGVEYTWGDVDRGVSAVASELRALGVGPGSHVALCGANSLNWILTFFAIQKMGAVAVLLNPQLTSEEVAALSRLGDITHFCYGKSSVGDRRRFLAQITNPDKSQIRAVLDVGDEIDFLNRPVTASPAVRTKPDDACLIIFTSGSTGTPKGVLLSASYVINSSDCCVHKLAMTEGDRLCAILPFFHIFGLTAVLVSCAICGSSMILPRSVKPDDLMAMLKNESCTVLHSIPTIIMRLANAPGFYPELASGIRASYLSGAPVSEAQLKMLMGKFPNNHFMRRYGLTEITPVSSTGLEDDIDHILQTVGKPVDGMDVRIKDMKTGGFCPVGTQGEIVVKGRYLMCGYYKMPANKQPFDEDGFLRTGDLGFLDAEGYLHYTGRVKEIIIRGGENIMPNEVAAAISTHDNIVDAKVLGVPDEIYGEIVVAAVVLREGTLFDGKEMRDFLMKKLAKYKVPAYFFIYDKLPTLANGKVDAVTLKKEIVGRLANMG